MSMIPEIYVVRSHSEETHDTFTIEIAPKSGPAFAFGPGQFSMLYVFGTGEVPISHSGSAASSAVHVHTIRRVGTVTEAIGRLRPGDEIGVRGPFGSAWPVSEADGGHLLIAAGGIGLAPLRPAVYAALAFRERYAGVHVFYGARSPEEALYTHEQKRWGKAGIHVHSTVDKAPAGWEGHVGLVTTLLKYGTFAPDRTTALICGPEVMMKHTARELAVRGVDPRRIHLSMERNMKCAVGICGHCQYGPHFVCKDGPVFPFPKIEKLLSVKEL